jgi:hypothetical protein
MNNLIVLLFTLIAGVLISCVLIHTMEGIFQSHVKKGKGKK